MPGKRLNSTGEVREIPPNHITAWRNFRKLTLEQLAEKTGLAVPTISEMANGKQDVTGKSLFELAAALDTTPGALLDVDPRKFPIPFWEVYDRLSQQEKEQVVRLTLAIRGD
jgi:transcriptional regulator with XRE-family HTH domain